MEVKKALRVTSTSSQALVDDKQSKEKIDALRAVGAEIHVCPTNVSPEDPRSYYSVARKLHSEIPNSVFINQYDK